MNRRIRDVFTGAVVKTVNLNTYTDTGNKWCNVSINGKVIHQRFTSFVNPTCKGGYSDFVRKSFVIASDGYATNNTIQVCGVKFDIKEVESKNPKAKNKTYIAIMKNNKKIGCFFNQQQRCKFYNICI